MTLDKEVKKRILKDYKVIQGEIHEISQGRANCLVWKNDYVTPTVVFGTNLSRDDWRGELKYFSQLRTVLEYALNNGTIPQEWGSELTSHAPDYLNKLVEQKNKKETLK